jgi:ankyrin repeat protein
MVYAAQTNNELLMKHLLNNAITCNHEDALDLMFNFIPTKTDDIMKKLTISLLKTGNREAEKSLTAKISLSETKASIEKCRHEIFDDVHLFFPQVMKLYKADTEIMNQYICTVYTDANLQTIATEKITPLQVAAGSSNVAMIELLFLNGHEKYINDADIQGYTPLCLAENIDTIKILLQCKNIQPNKRTTKGMTPLYKAVCKCKQPIIDLFLSHPNFIINEEDENQLTPLHTAAQLGNEIAFEFFFKHTEGKVRNTTKPIHYAAAYGHSNIIATILKKDISQLNIQNNVGETPLFLASTYNQLFGVNLLINLGAAIDLAEQNNITPLWIASQNGCDNAVVFLLNNKANVNALSNDKVTPLWKAAQNGKTNIVRWLLENKAFVDHADEDGVTPLIMASQKGYNVIVKLLLKFGANPTLQTSDGITALDVADNDEIEELLNQALKLK